MTVRSTSAQVYREDIEPSLPRREQIVLDGLKDYGSAPTAYELTEFLRQRHQAFDVNSCRPRLTALLAKGKVVTGEKRRCHITNKTALTWLVAMRYQEPTQDRLWGDSVLIFGVK